MKAFKTFSIVSLALFIAACASKSPDKKTELDKLIKEQAELNDKISKLKSELEKSGDSPFTPNFKSVIVKTLATEPFRHYVDVQAKVDADQSVNANPKMSGTITDILVKEGDHVSEGQILAKTDDALLKQNMNDLQTQVDFATNVYNKQKNLWDQKIGSEMQFLTAKNNKESLEHKMAALREQWAMSQIKSPINGTVDNIFIKTGQAVMPGMPCINVVNLEGLKVKAEVAEGHITKIKPGDEVIITIPDEANKEIKGKVSFASSVINNISRTFTVEVRLNGNDQKLKPNMVAVMHINDYKNPEAIAIPVNVVQSSSEGKYVLIAANEGGKNIVKKKEIETGKSYNGIVEISNGLNAGDRLIVTGFEGVNPGDEVKL